MTSTPASDRREREGGDEVPKAVEWCATGAKTLVLWRRDGQGEPVEAPFRCKSWRCPRCRSDVALVDYARIAQALAARGPWVYVVVTLPGAARRASIWSQYREVGRIWDRRMRGRLRRRYGRVEYVQTWESHRNGTPHANVVLGGESLIGDVDELGDGGESYHPRLRRRVRVPRWRRWWMAQARAAGFGRVGWVERLWDGAPDAPRPTDGMASYMVTLAHSLGALERRSPLDRTAGELARADHKAAQVPVQAPKGFRRLRASRGTLPPRYSSPEWTGAIRDSSGEPWHWGVIAERAAARAEAIESAQDTLARLEADGLPVPPGVARMALREP